MTGEGAQLRAESEAYLNGDEEALGRVACLVLDIIERPIAGTLKRSGQSSDGWCKVDVVEAANEVLDRKLGPEHAESFCRELASADDPRALLATAAANVTLDMLRKRMGGDVDLKPPTGGEDARSRDDWDERWGAPVLEPLDEMLESEAARRLRDALARAAEKDRLVLGVLFAGLGLLSEEQIEELASRRGASIETVRAELEVRAERWFVREQRICRALAKRGVERYSQVQKIRRLERLIEELKDPPDVTADSSVQLNDYGSTSSLRDATPEVRAGILKVRRDIIAQKDGAIAKLSEQRADPLLRAPEWEEAAIILGMVDSDAPQEVRDKAANTLTVRWRRARKRLIEAARVEGGR